MSRMRWNKVRSENQIRRYGAEPLAPGDAVISTTGRLVAKGKPHPPKAGEAGKKPSGAWAKGPPAPRPPASLIKWVVGESYVAKTDPLREARKQKQREEREAAEKKKRLAAERAARKAAAPKPEAGVLIVTQGRKGKQRAVVVEVASLRPKSDQKPNSGVPSRPKVKRP